MIRKYKYATLNYPVLELMIILLLHSRLLSDVAIQLCRHILIYVKTKQNWLKLYFPY
jgi:hypothetical protein